MNRRPCLFGAALVMVVAGASPLAAQDIGSASTNVPLAPASGIEVWASRDSDKTAVLKLLGRALWDYQGASQYQGIDVERAWFSPDGQRTREQTRAYLDFAGSLEGQWNWSAKLGTNGSTVLGSASIRTMDWDKELFVEREVVETPKGLDQGIYYSFAGASADLVSGPLDTLSAMVGFQKFTGKNARIHLRSNYVHVLNSKLGVSVQLRARYFHSTVPGEFDYYSPRDFEQLIPVIQLRHFTNTGCMILVAGGYGVQKATATGLEASRLADVRLESPVRSRHFRAFVQLLYSNSSLVGAAGNYRYFVGRLGLTTRL